MKYAMDLENKNSKSLFLAYFFGKIGFCITTLLNAAINRIFGLLDSSIGGRIAGAGRSVSVVKRI